ncbi:DUF3040 domain-containing protein [Streptomyces fagopyri]|uniref:DUF3040 domain-containing protein n=1 Tax=Streptomyces fagopyri TaxID=2662397 RepID=A0A5Q0LK01_9ACTN|nr:DUF3040 domain-containing protein [Streptomyces fagopyri]QFZ77221.1 DUF3040 domain-containing protein [Streptomyces fagopyri]
MTPPVINPREDLETQTRQSDTPFARGPQTGHPRRPCAYRRRRGTAWSLLALSIVMLITGMVLPQGLLVAAGLVATGLAAHFLTPPSGADRPRLP